MKNLLRLLPFLGIAIVFKACTNEPIDQTLRSDLTAESPPPGPCVDDSPITRIINNGSLTIALSVRDENGVEVVNFHYVPPNTTTSWASFDSGLHIFYVSDINDDTNSSFDKAQLQMDNCMSLEIEVDSNNDVISFVPTTL